LEPVLKHSYCREVQSENIRRSVIDWGELDPSHWRSICDVTLTLKQTRLCVVPRNAWTWSKHKELRVAADEIQCKKALRHFMNLLNRAVYGNAVRRYGKRLRVIAVVEKESCGRWHLHVAIEPPINMMFEQFAATICDCWLNTDWGYRQLMVRRGANEGWIGYMLKLRQKSELDAWIDCIDLDTLHNPPKNC
jgi:hypothetical protein